MKLYKVTLKGLKSSITGVNLGYSYVLADDPSEAYNKLKKFIEDRNLGFEHEREMEKIELPADSYEYNNTGHIIILN